MAKSYIPPAPLVQCKSITCLVWCFSAKTFGLPLCLMAPEREESSELHATECIICIVRMPGGVVDWALSQRAEHFAFAGLDARAAAIVMRTVRNTVNTGRTVVCTIHQPSIDIFEVC